MKKWLITALICFFLMPVLVNAEDWTDDAQGESSSGGKGVCNTPSSCYCVYNNRNFGAAKVSIKYYVNGQLHTTLNDTPVIIYNGSSGYVTTNFGSLGLPMKHWSSFPSNGQQGFAESLKSLLMNKTGSYGNMRTLFDYVLSGNSSGGYTYDSVLQKVTKGEWQNGSYGSGTGVRVIFEQLYTIMSNDKCSERASGIIYGGTVSAIAKFIQDTGYSKSNLPILENYHVLGGTTYVGMAETLYAEVKDVYGGALSGNKTISEIAKDTTGWGKGIFSPFSYLIDEPISGEESSCEDFVSINKPTCSSESYGRISDIDDWDCIFNSSSEEIKSRYMVASYGGPSGNYCKIYCKQDITAELPGNNLALSQGRYAVVGSQNINVPQLSPIKYNGIKNCVITSDGELNQINVKLFEIDYQHHDNLVNSAWDAAQNSYANYLAAQSITYDKNNGTSRCVHSGHTDADRARCSSQATGKTEAIREKQYSSCLNNTPQTCFKHEYTYSYSATATNGAYSGSYSFSYTLNNPTTEKEFNDKKKSEVSAARGVYDNALQTYNVRVRERQKIYDSLEECTRYSESLNYSEFEPELLFEYEEPVYGNYGNRGWNLEEKKAYEDKKLHYYSNGTEVDYTYLENHKKTISFYACGTTGSKCIVSNVRYFTTSSWTAQLTKNYDYILSDKYRYILKSGESKDKLDDVDKNSMQYIDVGYGNMPIHYSTKPGDYAYKIQVSSFGENNSMNKYIYDFGTYDCNYNVSCDDILISSCDEYVNICGGRCPMSGLNVIYRTISLYSKGHAFPGIDGKGRTPGDNWNNDKLINDYIVNNRGVKDYEVYRIDPLYEIELTPGLMKIIRKYNKEQNKTLLKQYWKKDDSQGVIAGYADFSNMVCDQEGENCISSLLRGQVSGYNEIKVKGCAINGTGYTNCGTSV